MVSAHGASIAVVRDTAVDDAALRWAGTTLVHQLLAQRGIGFAHVQLLVVNHAKFADLLDLAAFARVQDQGVPPYRGVGLGDPDDVPGHHEMARLVPEREAYARRAVGHSERSNFAVLFGGVGVAKLEDDKHDVDVLLPRANVLYQNTVHF